VHEGWEIGLWSFNEEVVMVIHEGVGMEDNLKLAKGFLEIEEELFIVRGRQEDFFPFISSGGDVVKSTFENNSQGTSHKILLNDRNVAKSLSVVKV
jgi:hypothetical protein